MAFELLVVILSTKQLSNILESVIWWLLEYQWLENHLHSIIVTPLSHQSPKNSRLKINLRPSISWENVRTFTNWFAIFHLLFVYLLFIRLVDRLLPTSMPPYKPPTDFSIDAAHEMALFMWNVDKNLILKTVPYFCSRYGSDCAIYAKEESIFCVRQWHKV